MRYIVFLFFLFTVLKSQAQICPLCGIPNNFNIYTTDYQADISWSNNSDAIYYEIRYKEDDGNNGISNNWIYVYFWFIFIYLTCFIKSFYKTFYK